MPTRLPLRAGVLLGSALLLTGCSSMRPIEPWVKPYERERLADPIMQPSRNALSAKHFAHVYEVREGARGANGVQGGGCGCN
ncbi:DUF4266 domain-containing protein [Pelomonas cellulosilytica]|uniref:DUF4266 domain-containing protein n=1 Tax=Pelomonas cellulosilytica TaxID=2906762 RepID=A0ABS8XM89_9BURK|nr:DUF4266 domain-containing protein [Pelomonas sp. P8]MCE4552923.1 DUF4266 domain-containing protein [Pelomonas sp. P8]